MASGPDFLAAILSGREHLVIGGAMGGIVRWLTLREKFWPDGIITITTGMICAPYVSPFAVPFLSSLLGESNLTIEQTAHLSAFAVGLGGMTIAGLIIDLWRSRRKEINGDKSDDN